MASKYIVGDCLWISEPPQSLSMWCMRIWKRIYLVSPISHGALLGWPSEIPEAKTVAMASGTWRALLFITFHISVPTVCNLKGQARQVNHPVCVLSRSLGSDLSVAGGKVWGRWLELWSRQWGTDGAYEKQENLGSSTISYLDYWADRA